MTYDLEHQSIQSGAYHTIPVSTGCNKTRLEQFVLIEDSLQSQQRSSRVQVDWGRVERESLKQMEEVDMKEPIKDTASDVGGIILATIRRYTVRDRRTVTPENGRMFDI
ncbi:hypothetical protein TNCV_232081 [Trichonephila clavipes]|nr:hypothetical protein TNCV_232081 [Trichonephila clavipes]